MNLSLHDKIESAISYTIGCVGMSLPVLQRILELGTNLFTFLTALIGFLLVYGRWRHDHKKRKHK